MAGRKPGRPLWNRRVRPEELKDLELLPELFEDVVAAGLAIDSESDRIAFVALVTHVNRRRGVTSPVGLLTSLLQGTCRDRFEGRDWRQRPATADEDAAREIVRRWDAPPATEDPPRETVEQEANRQRQEFERKKRIARRALLGPCPGGVR